MNTPKRAFCLLLLCIFESARAQSDSDMVEIQSIDPSIKVELRYQTAKNLVGRSLYPPDFRAQLRRGVALRLRDVQKALQPSGLGLKIWDAQRPLAAQRLLFATVSDPRYVAAPGQRSMHNRGVAVDVTLVDPDGLDLPMPTDFDDMSSAAHYIYRGPDAAIRSRLLALQKAMRENGFYACRTEWWHFFIRDWEKYPNLDTQGLETGRLMENAKK